MRNLTVNDIVRGAAGLMGLDTAQVTSDPTLLARFIDYANAALQQLLDATEWNWLYAQQTIETNATDAHVDLPLDFSALHPNAIPYYADQAGYQLSLVQLNVINQRRSVSLATASRPYCYALTFNYDDADTPRHRMELWPSPGAVYQIEVPYRRSVPALQTLSDIPRIPTDLHETLRLMVIAETEEQYEQVAQGSQRPKANAMLAQARARYASAQRGQGGLRLRNDLANNRPWFESMPNVVEVIPPGSE